MSRFQGEKLSLIVKQLESENAVLFDNDFVTTYRRLVDRLFEEQLAPCDGVVQLLQSIQVPVCVASSGPKEKIQKALSCTGLLAFFNGALFSSYDIQSWKPDPDIFIHASREMGVNVSQCWVVDDSPLGIAAAILAGTTAIHYDPMGKHPPTAGVAKISHMNQLMSLIDSSG